VTIDDDLDTEVAEIAAAIVRVCAGRSTVAVYAAIATVLGFSEARAGKPDIDGLIEIVGRYARMHFDHERQAMN
jgi:hypothetical protein